jgi:NitT/TauT family transport system substrate-binding protein
MRVRRGLTFLALLLALTMVLAACGDDSDDSSSGSSGTTSTTTASTEPVTLRLGFFPNVTHGPAVVGIENGTFEKALGDNVTLEPVPFSAGPAAIEALFADAIDASFIGPNPAINGYAQSNGEALRIVSGSTSGGAFFVVKPEITKPEDLAGKKIATPQLGNTQDVAARAWLKEQGYATDTAGGGDVSIIPQENSITLDAFKNGDIDGAWVPEPWATRLIQEGGGTILVDEADLWPDGRYVTTHLIVATKFLDEHPDVVKQLIEGELDAIDEIEENPAASEQLVADGIGRVSGKPISLELVADSWDNLEFTYDPIASSLRKSAEDAESLGLLDPVDLDGIYDLTLLNEVLKERELEKINSK